MAKKKFSKKQLAAQKKFAQMAKSGKLAKLRKKSSRSTKKVSKSEQNRLRSARNKGISLKDRKDIEKLLLAVKNPNIKEIVIRK